MRRLPEAPCAAGDAGALYKFTLRDIYTASGTYGIVLQGAVFEGHVRERAWRKPSEGWHVHGAHESSGVPIAGIVSNIQLIHPNMSRNLGAGVGPSIPAMRHSGRLCSMLRPASSLRTACGLAFNNGENTGEAVYVVPSNGYGSSIIYSEGSTDGKTHARR